METVDYRIKEKYFIHCYHLDLINHFFFGFLQFLNKDHFFLISVNALLPALDLLEALELPKNHSRYFGVSVAQGMETHLIAYRLGENFFKNKSILTHFF